jgi:putative hydrolase of the HAD superfamily
VSGLPAFDALTLDVGGVFVVPDHGRLVAALDAAGISSDRRSFWDAHHLAMHAVDAEQAPAETFDTYVAAFAHNLGHRGEDAERVVACLAPLFGPSGLWTEPVPGSADALRALHDAGVPVAVVINADGSVAALLASAGVCQVGDGPLVPVVAIVDSGAVGVAKPDPAIFAAALEALGTDPARTLHVGDSVHYDIRGAQAAGMSAVHFDPDRLCPLTDHPHIRSLADLLG